MTTSRTDMMRQVREGLASVNVPDPGTFKAGNVPKPGTFKSKPAAPTSASITGYAPPSAGGAAEKAAHRTGVALLAEHSHLDPEDAIAQVSALVREQHPDSGHSDTRIARKLRRALKDRDLGTGATNPTPDQEAASSANPHMDDGAPLEDDAGEARIGGAQSHAVHAALRRILAS